jgi:holo-[acyl-carrier protein] synthase
VVDARPTNGLFTALDGSVARDDSLRMPFGIGIDLVHVGDVEDSLVRFGSRYLDRVFTPAEIRAAGGGSNAGRLAGCFAAKEAALKTLAARHTGIPWTSIEIETACNGEASLTLHGAAAEAAERAEIIAFELSVTRTEAYAAAIVLTVGCADRSLATGENAP